MTYTLSKEPILVWTSDDSSSEFSDENYDDLCSELSRYMQRVNLLGRWKGEVKNFGWMKRDGHKEFIAQTGQTFLSQLLPKADCRFKIYRWGNSKYRRGFAIQNFHHDSPMGEEWYFVLPCSTRNDSPFAKKIV